MIKSGSENCSWVGGVQFELETVTPLFLGGADPRGEPELRAASIRGALRFWLRALLGGFTGSSPHGLDQLRQAESKVFGSTATGASSVIVRIVQEQTSKTSFSKIVGELPGVAYLFFATRKIGNEPERIAINPETKFRLILSPRPVVKKGHLLLWHACAALWLLVHV